MTEIYVNSETGSDAHGTGTEEHPFLTPNRGLKQCSMQKDRVWLKGKFRDGMSIGGVWDDELVVEGQGSLLFGFVGDDFTVNPLDLPARTWGNLALMDCHNVTVKNLEVWGGNMQCVNLNDSYPEIGLKNVTLERVKARYGSKRGFFMGGHNIQDIFLHRCIATETCYGDTTHGIYLTGGHWRGDYPPVTNVELYKCKSSYSGGRHGIQLNGRFKKVLIEDCESWHNQRTSLSLIGVQDATVSGCKFWGNNDQGMVIYDYFDSGYWSPGDPEWKACHHPNKNITVENCTIAVGSNQWKRDHWHHHNPKNKPAVLVNCNLGAMFPDFKPSGILVKDCVLWTPWTRILEYGHGFDAGATKVKGNMACGETIGGPVATLTGKHDYPMVKLEQIAPSHYKDNVYDNPMFHHNPEYDFVDLKELGPFDFSHHHSVAHLYSQRAFELGKGASIPSPQVPENTDERPTDGAGSEPGLPWEEHEPDQEDTEGSEFPFKIP